MSEKNAVRAPAMNVKRKEQCTILIIDCLTTCAAMTTHLVQTYPVDLCTFEANSITSRFCITTP